MPDGVLLHLSDGMTLAPPPPAYVFHTSSHRSPVHSHVQDSLQLSLRLPRTQRWVADWLFTNLCETPFHSNLTLPPPHLSTALCISLANSVYLPRPLKEASSSDESLRNITISFFPVSAQNQITIGYCASFAPPNLQCLSSQREPFTSPYVGRFAFDQKKRELIITVADGKPRVIGIKSLLWKNGICREQFNFSLPIQDYSFSNLPQVVLSMMSNLEYGMDHGTDPLKASEQYKEDIRSSARYEPSILKGQVPSELPWSSTSMDTEKVALSEDICFMPWLVEGYEDLRNEKKALRNGMDALCVALCGLFHGPSLRLENLEMFQEECSQVFSGRLCYELEEAAESIREYSFREFAGRYYIAVLAMAADQKFLGVEEEPEQVERDWNFKKDRMLAPRPAEGKAFNVNSIKGKDGRSKEEIREERKKRNRMSAARSNARKQEKLKRDKEEIERNWKRVQELREKWEAVLSENIQLKQLLGLL